jgi:DNA-binding transcriptional MerR regulator
VDVTWYSGEGVAERAGVEPSYLVRLVDLGILAPEGPDRFSQGDVRRVLMARSLEDAGIPLDDVVAAIEHGALSLDFVDAAGFERFAALADETFRQVSERIGIPLELLMVVREAIGMALPSPMTRSEKTRWRSYRSSSSRSPRDSVPPPSSVSFVSRVTAPAGSPNRKPPGGSPR